MGVRRGTKTAIGVGTEMMTEGDEMQMAMEIGRRAVSRR
jgi:hypothetical protein